MKNGLVQRDSKKVRELAIIVAISGACIVGILELLYGHFSWESFLEIAAILAIGILLFLLVYFIGNRLETAKAARADVHSQVVGNIEEVVRIELELDLKERREYANGLFYIVIIWLLGITAFLLLDGFWTAYIPSHSSRTP